MKLLLRYFRLAPGSMPQGHGNDNHARVKRIAEIRRLLAEIAVEPPEQRVCPEQDQALPAGLRPRLRARAGEAVEKSARGKARALKPKRRAAPERDHSQRLRPKRPLNRL